MLLSAGLPPQQRFRSAFTFHMRILPSKRLFMNVISMHPTGKPTGYGPSSRRSHNRGIVDECCFQSCELRRLEMYCAPVKPGKTPRSLRAQRHTDSPRTAKKPISGHSHSSCKEVHQKNSSRGNTGGRNYRM
ncbi:insulin-like growth factor I, adult form [Sinocyclocheilus grahami]|uniref:insulin-like growth factor I, adult form n=1 Tax=Sinocyclocheilus grahami TaxID=75366 RepID=UPI0007ACC128|nr:PREDICTED: insulin-like growth factor I, adult form [Sinocyclocheilus grahami]